MKQLIKEFVVSIVESSRLKESEAVISDGSSVKWGSEEHIEDLEKRISALELWKVRQKRGTESRANYSRLINQLKNELKSAKRVKEKRDVTETSR